MDVNALNKTRLENDTRLADSLPAIASAIDRESLSQFAKAYLGQYLNIDSSVAPAERVRLLASEALANAVFEGFAASLQWDEMASPADIGEAATAENDLQEDVIILAALDYLGDTSISDLLDLDESVLQTGLCFHFAHITAHRHEWVNVLLRTRPDIAMPALSQFWQGMVGSGTDFLPGLHQFVSREKIEPMAAEIILPLIRSWGNCKDKVLRELLCTALAAADLDELMSVCADKLSGTPLEGNRRVYWLATASCMNSMNYIDALVHYVDRSREKALRLLDYLTLAMPILASRGVRIAPEVMGKFLLVIAAKFPPQGDLTAPLDDTSQKVLTLFEYLGEDVSEEAGQVLETLRTVRVMRICDAVIDYTEALQYKARKA